MEKLFLTLVLFWFSVCSFAEDYSFSVIKSGIGKKSVIFIPGFASSGDVWKEAVAELGTHYTCYVLTMAGFAGVPPENDLPGLGPAGKGQSIHPVLVVQGGRQDKAPAIGGILVAGGHGGIAAVLQGPVLGKIAGLFPAAAGGAGLNGAPRQLHYAVAVDIVLYNSRAVVPYRRIFKGVLPSRRGGNGACYRGDIARELGRA